MQPSRSFMARFWRAILWLLFGWFVVTIGSVFALRWLDPPTTAFMLRERLDAVLSRDPHYVQKHRWTDWPQIGAPMKIAVIASEDQTFPDHHGFDLKSINDALEERERGGRVRGASTISQQVAKNLFLWPGQSWIRKALEAYFTVLIESLWPKRRILEMYLNVAEFGQGVFGVGAAAETFFGKPAARLSYPDAALLAAVLPNPKRMRVDRPSGYVRARQQWIMEQMRGLGGTSLMQKLE